MNLYRLLTADSRAWRLECEGPIRNTLKWGWVAVKTDEPQEADRVAWTIATRQIVAYRGIDR